MALTNKERIGRGLDLVRDGLIPIVEQRFQQQYGAGWTTQLASNSSQRVRQNGTPDWDTYRVLKAMEGWWKLLFERLPIGRAERNFVGELLDWRNKHAHDEPLTSDDVYRALDTAQRLLQAFGASAQALQAGEMKLEGQRVADQERARNKTRYQPVLEGVVQPGLKPWRQIVTPHKDVASGTYMQAEFAADLAQVHTGGRNVTPEYGDPAEFYRRTYLTDGLRELLEDGLKRLAGKGGDPVVELQTNFGGGKTHSMLALYHLFSGVPSSTLEGAEVVLRAVGVSQAPRANRAVLVGTALSPGQVVTKADGTEVRTLWGELAWQLGGRPAFDLVADSDARGISPGSDVLAKVLGMAAPCLVLIDEWVAYARLLIDRPDSPAGNFDSQTTFAQALTEAAKRVNTALVVASIPSSDIEIGGENGRHALAVLKNVFERVGKPWRPASGDEGFEIVRRRLFEPIHPDHVADRDATVDAFLKLYKTSKDAFPPEVSEADYRERMQRAYPVHPELFRRLYDEWSTLDRFQRTRGVLRLLAKVVHRLWVDEDHGLVVLPASVPMDDGAVKSELTRYLHDQWEPIISQDIDGPDSRPMQLDSTLTSLGRYSATRRVARTLYIGTAPGSDSSQPGVGAERILLGSAQPGETLGAFTDALRRLSDAGQHIHQDGNRYWVSSKANLNRTAEGKANAYLRDQDALDVEIIARLRKDKQRADFASVHICPSDLAEVPDEPRARLVVLGPEVVHLARRGATDTPALRRAREIFESRGNAPRVCRNALVFVAADQGALADLRQAVANFLAWRDIDNSRESLNLDAFQMNQAKDKRAEFDGTCDLRISHAWIHVLAPSQTDPSAPVQFAELKIGASSAPLAQRVADKLVKDELLMRAMGPVRLRMALDSVPLWRDGGRHVSLKQLADDFSRYVYLPRFTDSQVLVGAVQAGVALQSWEHDAFAFADAYDERAGRYRALRTLVQLPGLHADSDGLLVNPAVAVAQIAAETAAAAAAAAANAQVAGANGSTTGVVEPVKVGPTPDPTPPVPQVRRYYGRVQLDPIRAGADASRITAEVISHLTGLMNADVTVTLEIQAKLADGAPEHVVRVVTENGRTLKFETQGFERD